MSYCITVINLNCLLLHTVRAEAVLEAKTKPIWRKNCGEECAAATNVCLCHGLCKLLEQTLLPK
jgi:hypothetical protein